MRKVLLPLLLGCGLSATLGCVAPTEAPPTEGQTGVVFDELTATRVSGAFEFRGQSLRFEAEILDTSHETTFDLRGMVLTFTADVESGAFDVDGFTLESGADTHMTAADRAVVQEFDRALGDVFQQHGQELPALDLLVRNATLWEDYSDSLVLTRSFLGRLDRDNVGTGVNLCSLVNKPGQGLTPKYRKATHDCWSGAGDCSNWWGCDGGEDNASADYVFLSMHPPGPCSDTTWYGNTTGSYSCYEPDHPSDHEYGYGACFGRCGGDCGSGTVFSQACLDHDQCVRFGHSTLAAECDDDFVNAAWDTVWMSNCGGVNFSVPYNWASRGNNPACPTSWQNTNDGCDVNCQFVDMDCFR